MSAHIAGSESQEAMKQEVKITLVQFQEQEDDVHLLERMRSFFEQAAQSGSDLIAFPEYCLGRMISTEHAHVQGLLSLAEAYGMYAVAGLVEQSGAQWSTTALVVDRAGNLLGRYLKTHPAAGVTPHWWPPLAGHDAEAQGTLGNQFKVFHLDFGTLGILQCYDGYFPEAWGCTSYAGAEIILWINGRNNMVQDAYCISAAHAYGCVVGANISDGWNTGFAEPRNVQIIAAEGDREEMRLFPRIREKGDSCVHATVDLDELRKVRKHLRTMHQRRPDLYGPLTQDVKMWQDYPEVPWEYKECAEFVNKAQLP